MNNSAPFRPMLRDGATLLLSTNGRGRRGLYFIFFVLLILASPLTYAATIGISPVRLSLSAGQKITSFDVINESDKSVIVEIQGKKWRLHEEKDSHEPTQDLLITPPLVTIGPRESQLIRVGLRGAVDPEKGGTYRIFVKEIPQPSPLPANGVNTVLEIRFPLLVDPLIPSKPQGVFSARRGGGKEIKVTLLNTGKSHFALNILRIRQKRDARPLVEKEIFNYLIPNQKKEWVLEIPASFKGGDIQISAGTDQGEFSSLVPLLPGAAAKRP